MKARIVVPPHVHDHTWSELVAAQKAAVRQLLDGGGKGSHDRDVDDHVYEFDGPAELVRPVVAAFMATIAANGD